MSSTNTSIEWTDKTWNPIRGCTRVSDGCRHCYAERMAYRFSGPGKPYEGLVKKVGNEARWTGEIKLVEKDLELPYTWHKPQKVFVNSMSDLFHEKVPFAYIDRIIEVMYGADTHTYQILTKRPARMLEYFKSRYTEKVATKPILMSRETSLCIDWPQPHIWFGVSVENQEAANERIPLLLKVPAAVRFLSCEPLLDPVDLLKLACPNGPHYPDKGSKYPGYCNLCCNDYADNMGYLDALSGGELHWVIVGGESGPGARMMNPDWARKLRDQCQETGVAFHFKQWGEHGLVKLSQSRFFEYAMRDEVSGQYLVKLGKKAAGRELDGVEWNEFPDVA